MDNVCDKFKLESSYCDGHPSSELDESWAYKEHFKCQIDMFGALTQELFKIMDNGSCFLTLRVGVGSQWVSVSAL